MAEKQSKRGWRAATPSANMDCFKRNLLCRGQRAALLFPSTCSFHRHPLSINNKVTPMTDRKQTNPEILPSEPSSSVAAPSHLQALGSWSAFPVSFVRPQISTLKWVCPSEKDALEPPQLMGLPGDCNLSAEMKYGGMHGTIRERFNSGNGEGLNKCRPISGSQESAARRQRVLI